MSVVVSFRFPAGRYHATPWDAQVNEARIEWPPSPWRIARALVATWHRKASHSEFPEQTISSLIEALAASPPVYGLPVISSAHTRHYMPVRSGANERRVLVFDGFAHVAATDELIVGWPDLELEPGDAGLLARLVGLIGYLGRAESWVEGRMLDSYNGEFNCVPVDEDSARVSSLEGDEGDISYTSLRLLAPVPGSEYAAWRGRTVRELGLDARRLRKAQQHTLATLPDRLIDALRIDTGQLRYVGWNLPPGGKMVTYRRERLEETVRFRQRSRPRPEGRIITTVRLALSGRPLPRIEDAVRIGELTRGAAISVAGSIGTADVPLEISGHGSDDLNHRHSFYLPEDADRDGRIDRILIYASGGLSRDAVAALDRIKQLWVKGSREKWDVVFEGAWANPSLSGSVHVGPASQWVSMTPYLHPWYAKRNFGVTEQIARECGRRGLPGPVEVSTIESIEVRGRQLRPVHFHRFRSKRGLRQPDRRGSFLRITFPDLIGGPLALGFACHYGLGLFTPVQEPKPTS